MFLKAGCDYQSSAIVVQKSSLDFKAATKTFFLSISVDVIRPVFREQETKTWMESGRRKNCGNMSTACREIAIFGLKLTTEAVLLTHCKTANAAR